MSFFKKMVDKFEDLVGDDDKKKAEHKKEEKHEGMSFPTYCSYSADTHLQVRKTRAPSLVSQLPTTNTNKPLTANSPSMAKSTPHTETNSKPTAHHLNPIPAA